MSKIKDDKFKDFHITGLSCMDCAGKIEDSVSKLKWVEKAKVNFATSLLKVFIRDDSRYHALMGKEIEKVITKLGFGIEKGKKNRKHSIVKEKKLFILTATALLFICAGIITKAISPDLEIGLNNTHISVAFYFVAIVSGVYFIGQRGLHAIRNLRMDINFLMCIAVIGSACIGEWLEGATVVFLFLLAQLLEIYTLDKARNVIRSLMAYFPKEALLKNNNCEKFVNIEEIKVNDIIIVRPGDRIPLDGIVINGHSFVNQSTITGESIPIEKTIGSKIYAGTINERGAMEVKVSCLSKESTLAKIIHLIEEAQSRKAPFQNFIDNFARYYTPVVIFLAVLVAFIPPFIFDTPFATWFYRALVLLVISCPCSLVISTPVSLIAGITRGARKGILFKGGVYLEQIGNINAIAFDKTGTLTTGKLTVTDIINLNSKNADELLRLAASIECKSEHSIGCAIVEKARKKGLDLVEGSEFESLTGKGAVMKIEQSNYYVGNSKFFEEQGFLINEVDDTILNLRNMGKTVILLGSNKIILGIIAVSDEVRKMSRQTIKDLYNKKVKKIVMLTGDHKCTASTISKELEIEEFVSELSPAGKVDSIKSLIKEYGSTAMVGDGVNDAPALATATVGIAMGSSGTDVTLESADITIMGDDLAALPFAIELGRHTIRIIKQNIYISILIKGVFLSLAVPGITTLWMAVGADMGASLIVIFNGLRLLNFKKNNK